MSGNAQRFIRQARDWEGPSWWSLSQGLFFFIIILLVGYRLLAPSNTVDMALTEKFTKSNQITESKNDIVGNDNVEISYISGDVVEVPLAALENAQVASIAKLTGDFTGVSILEGVNTFEGDFPQNDFKIVKSFLVSEQNDTLTFSFELENTEGGELFKVVTSVVMISGQWYWAGV